MRRLLSVGWACLLAAGAIGLGGPRAAGGEAEVRYPQVVRVEKTLNNQPFEYRVESRAAKHGCMVYRLSYPSPVVTAVKQNNTIPAELYLPAGLRPGDARRPAVICIHILDGNMELVRMNASVLASRGIPAILFKLPYYGERGLPEGPEAMARNPKLFTEAIAQAMQDVRRTVDVLVSRPEIDPDRIGITGISLGGIVAGTAAEMEPRIGRAMLVLAGGDLLTIIHHARETRELSQLIHSLPPGEKAEVEKALAEVDPLRHADRLRERARQGKVRMVNAAVDEVIPRACTEKLADALGIADRVEWLDGLGHYTALAALPQVLQSMVEFFGQDLPPGVKPTAPPPPRRTPVQMVITLAQEAIGFFTDEPAEGRCHFADLELVATPQDQKPIEGRLRLISGHGGKFKLEAKAPVIGEIAIGQGNYPWMMAAGGKMVFKGTLNRSSKGSESHAKASADPLAFADPRYRTRLKVLAGAVAGAALAPDIVDPLAAVSQEPSKQGGSVIRIQPRKRSEMTVRVGFKEDGKTPEAVDFDAEGIRGTLKFRVWQINTVAAGDLFDPPAAAPAQEVEAVELRRIFSAMFNFAMENLE